MNVRRILHFIGATIIYGLSAIFMIWVVWVLTGEFVFWLTGPKNVIH